MYCICNIDLGWKVSAVCLINRINEDLLFSLVRYRRHTEVAHTGIDIAFKY